MELNTEIRIHLDNPNREEGEANLSLLIAQEGENGQAALDAAMAERLDIFTDGHGMIRGHAAVLALRGEETAIFVCPGQGHYRHCFAKARALAKAAGFIPAQDIPFCIPS